jgi:deoxyribodipyrimidine photo-lyase
MRPDARYVLYWAQMNRRTTSNHALAHAISIANELSLPVLYYEGLTCSYPHANDRFHTFILEGVPETADRLRALGIGYVFYLRRKTFDPDDVLYRLAADAAVVITDDYPAFVAAVHNARVPEKIGVAYYAVDSSCIVPMSRFEKREYAAYTLRPKIQGLLPKYFAAFTMPEVARRWNGSVPAFHMPVSRNEIPALVASCDIDHSVPPSLTYRGGMQEAEVRLNAFLDRGLSRYAKEKNEPSANATSRLSPYLHFGQISSLEIALAVRARAEREKLIDTEFLEELIVRRELAFNHARHAGLNPASLDLLPKWAKLTLQAHAKDVRVPLYSREEFETAATHDVLWNATQSELLLRGTIHGYYRMYWGKKILEWAPSPQKAVETMVYLHDRYALDGRDPNTYTNILWCLGLHDRPWFKRPIFGVVRYMSLDGMKRKTDVDSYLKEIDYLKATRTDPFLAI